MNITGAETPFFLSTKSHKGNPLTRATAERKISRAVKKGKNTEIEGLKASRRGTST